MSIKRPSTYHTYYRYCIAQSQIVKEKQKCCLNDIQKNFSKGAIFDVKVIVDM